MLKQMLSGSSAGASSSPRLVKVRDHKWYIARRVFPPIVRDTLGSLT